MPESEICHFSIAENERRVSDRDLALLVRMDDFRLASFPSIWAYCAFRFLSGAWIAIRLGLIITR
jgi:hypothetical protein